MNKEQEFTPKYWIGHDKRSDDVILDTASKHMYVSAICMEGLYGEDWEQDDNLEIILVEVKQVDM